MLTPLAVLTLIVGNVVAIVQTNMKRMLAYSTIGNVGFILLGFVAGTPGGYSAALYYTLVYVLVVLRLLRSHPAHKPKWLRIR